jgi:hypothetical protein
MESPDQVKDKYELRIRNLLLELGSKCRQVGLTKITEIDECTGDEYTWEFCVNRGRKTFGITFTIVEQAVRDGEGDGITFLLEVVAEEGYVVGQYAPYNYSPRWVVDIHDDDAVETRFQLIHHLDMGEVVYGILDFKFPRVKKANRS